MNIKDNTNISVIGYGSWATALVSVLTENGKSVNWYIRNREILESVRTNGVNCKYLQDIDLKTDLICTTDDINEAVRNGNLIFIAMPSAFLKEYFSSLDTELDDKFLVSAVKGIVPGEYVTVTEFFHQHYSVPYARLGVICGPTHAEEVSHRRMTYISAACKDEEDARIIGGLIGSKYLNVNYSTDIYGIEYAAILKNIYAIAAGIVTGLGYGDNFLANFVANCAIEMKEFITSTNPSDNNSNYKNSIGDLLVTCYSSFSRNRRFGQLIGKGCTVKSALNEMTMVAEGYYAAEGMHHINTAKSIELPIMETVYRILYQKSNARREIESLANNL